MMEYFSQAVLDALLDHIAVLDKEGNIIAINKAWVNFSIENGGDLQRTGIGNNYLIVCSQEVRAGILQVLTGGLDHFNYEYPCHSTNQFRWFLLRVTSIKLNQDNGAVVSHVNITDRKLTEIQLERNEQLYRHIAENSTDLISLHTLDGKYTYVSPNYLSLLGYSANEMVEKSPWDFIHEEDIQKMKSIHENMDKTDEIKTITYRFRCKNGNYIWIESKYKQVLSPDKVSDEIICVSRDVTKNRQKLIELEEEKKLLKKTVYTDSLTGIFNRRYFNRQFKKAYQQFSKENISFSLLVIDIDYFKQYNDSYGHKKGDECLIRVADTLARGVRKNDIVCRIGGEEFCAILPNTNKEEAISLAERLCKNVQELKIPHSKSNVSSFVTVSIGVATANSSGNSIHMEQEKLFLLADQALYKSKKRGRNQVNFYD
ncbi:GGDEF domain-containing protein [Neobacillus niacini]|uniref:sensor domain-containing diguanylate cyclase n=1 Tax=Neobacillus niacini TaxID=86668 RepID=UPI0021CB9996|nr:GGDEF domain-containing protein [Neobacillus niacini]MCM3763762.1 GGDEF domain-containing protein [Neobacillus niacini]